MARVLVVEDDPISAKMIRDFLSAHGHPTVVATTGPEGVSSFVREEPDLMIVDVALPKKNGFEVCFEVKRTERGQRTPLLLMSAVYRDSDHAARYAQDDLRAQGYLVKPFDLRDLLARVEELVPAA
ncbi:MAG TPA: response regulator [Sandaracinaceae bacterium LLY-WYZ-13_1]|nr:response regulator [Sandaracinaceae bacterium LLY-WYZ-13_1]